MSSLETWISNLVKSVVTTTSSSTNVHLFGVTGADAVSASDTQTYPEPPSLAVSNHTGCVTVRGEPRDDVSVTVTKRARSKAALEDVHVRARDGEGEPLRFETITESPSVDVVVDIEIRVPAGLPVDHLETKNGSITAADVGGNPRLETKNGAVEARSIDGYVSLEGTNGELLVRDVRGVDRATVSNGTLDLEIDAIRQDVPVSATNGTIEVLAGPDLDANVSLEATIGSIEASAFGATESGLGGSTVSGTLGDGTHRLEVSTSVGSIEFDRRA